MSQRWRCRGVSSIVAVVGLAASSGVRADEPGAAAGTVLVNLAPSDSVHVLRLHAYDDSVPTISCEDACSVRVQSDVTYRLEVTDEHGTSSTRVSFSQPESLRVTPPSHVLRFTGKSMLFGGAAVFVTSTVIFVYAAIRNLSLAECESDCDSVSSGVVRGTLVGMAAGGSIAFVGGILTLATSGPGTYRLKSPPAFEPRVSWRMAF